MKRTTIMLPEELRSKALRRARKKGVSLGSLIRESLEGQLKEPLNKYEEDPLFQDNAVFGGEAPQDLAGKHDKYLYGEDS